jgi:hypothetical protein
MYSLGDVLYITSQKLERLVKNENKLIYFWFLQILVLKNTVNIDVFLQLSSMLLMFKPKKNLHKKVFNS